MNGAPDRVLVPDQELEVPAASGEVLLRPSGDLRAVARANAARLDAARLAPLDLDLGPLRREARTEALLLARRYTAALGLAVPGGTDAEAPDLLFVTGHQPVFPHPGIWVKYLLLDRLARPGAPGLVVVVDSDAMDDLAVEVPALAVETAPGLPRLVERRREVLRHGSPDRPYEGQPPPDEAEWAGFLERVGRHLATLPDPELHRRWAAFTALGRPQADSLAAFLTVLRRRYEGPRRLLDLPVSLLAGTAAFRRFVLAVARDARRFAEIHNRHLEAYRARHRIRTTAQPFSNLEVAGDRVELPFWCLVEGRRARLVADLARRRWGPDGEALVPIPSGPHAPEFDALPVRPRALTLTAFVRLCLADLFVHGVSGGRYDRVTDAVVQAYFAVAPPTYAVASATLHLPLRGATDPAAARQAVQRALQDARHNPERLLAAPTPAQRALIEEKWRLIARLRESPLTRRERRAATQAIRRINAQLAEGTRAHAAVLEAALARLEAPGAQDAVTYRGYPFFLFPVEEVDALVDRMVESSERGPGGREP
ncbi:MAG: hypothetical protein QN122_07090 [Armatimonadota bacterium]|nr:hypothetical protein [Armatimonadota bacterium]MDR7449083.1 hypothetical protein [Armatimonadota bacterium]MDR7459163.1 hypothetical protein [Armatimonadota bacterium]MDR7480435.1 hypothetical protein [Armatimonadota bacterium]MDR7489382.1 hypothetical protein [Armatimonadota bacterium]